MTTRKLDGTPPNVSDIPYNGKKGRDKEIAVVWESIHDDESEESLLSAFEMIFRDQPMFCDDGQLDGTGATDR
jgi:hypothetical protein